MYLNNTNQTKKLYAFESLFACPTNLKNPPRERISKESENEGFTSLCSVDSSSIPLITKGLCPFESLRKIRRFVAEVINNPKGLPYKTGENAGLPLIEGSN